jgi:hypothetical protein
VEDLRAGSDKGSAKLNNHVEEVDNSLGKGDEDAETHVDLHVGRTADDMMFRQATLDYHALAVNLHHAGQSLGVARIDNVKFC